MNFDFKKFFRKNTGFVLYIGSLFILSLAFIGLSFAKKGQIKKERQRYTQNLNKLKGLDNEYLLDDKNKEVAGREKQRVSRLFREVYEERLCENNAITPKEVEALKKSVESQQRVSDLLDNPIVMRQYYSDVLVKKWDSALELAGMKHKVLADPKKAVGVVETATKTPTIKKGLDIDYSFGTWTRDTSPMDRKEVLPILEQFLVIDELIKRIAWVAEDDLKVKGSKQTTFELCGITRIPRNTTNVATGLAGDQYFVQKDFFRLLPIQFTVNVTPEQLEKLLTVLEQRVPKMGEKQRLFMVNNVSFIQSPSLSNQIKKRSEDIKVEVASIKGGLVYRDNFIATTPDRVLKATISVTFVDFKLPPKEESQEK